MITLALLSCIALMWIECFARDLKLIQVVFRHGDRAPEASVRPFYPLDPFANKTWYPEGWGGLNNAGKRRAYELGVFLRERYGTWLGDVYLKDHVVFQSSNIDRTMMSTQLLATGLFPPSKIQRCVMEGLKDSKISVSLEKWDPKLDWQPIPVFSDPSEINSLYAPMYECEKFKAMRRELEETDQFLVHRAEELSEFFDFVSKNVGKKSGQHESFRIYHQLAAEFSEKMRLPNWTEGIFPDGKLEEITAYDYVIQTYNKTLMRLNGGSWIRELLNNVDGHLNGSESRFHKGFFYGGHEHNIASILRALGVFKLHVPFYSSAIILELSEIKNEFYIKVLYRNEGDLQELHIPGCKNLDCRLDTFRKLFADIIVVDEESSPCQ